MALYKMMAQMILAGQYRLGQFGNNFGIHDGIKAELERMTGVVWTDDGPTDQPVGQEEPTLDETPEEPAPAEPEPEESETAVPETEPTTGEGTPQA